VSGARALGPYLSASARMAVRSFGLVIATPRRVSRRGVGYGLANRVCGLRSRDEEGRDFVAPVQPCERIYAFAAG